VNRRAFIKKSGVLAGLAGANSLLSTKMLRAEDSSVYSSATAIHAQTGAATFAGYGDANYWYNARLAIMAIGDEWTASNRDNEFVPALSYVDQSKINSAGVDLTAVLQQYQQFQPSMQMSDVQNIYRVVDDNQAMIPSVIQGLQNGMWVNFQNAAIIADNIGLLLSGSTTSSANAVTANSLSPDFRPPKDPGPPKGGHAYSCSADTATLFFLGLAFTTIGIMSAGTAPLLYGAAWGGVALWGGVGTTAWGAGHVIAGCPF